VILLGYTGTRTGMTPRQMTGTFRHVTRLTISRPGAVTEAHHGDCAGGDAEFHVIAVVTGCRTVAHPPADISRRAYCKADIIRDPKPYLDRDWDIAWETAELIAAPDGLPRPHSGTWTTVSYALQLGRPVTVILPDGTEFAGSAFAGQLQAAGLTGRRHVA
jgi:hypothetical protein